MDDTIFKPPWQMVVFYKTKQYINIDIEYKPFISNIPEYLIIKKEEINKYEKEHKWELAKKLANPYEMVYTQEEKFPYSNISLLKPLSRSYFKMIEILNISNFLKEYKNIQFFRSAHVAEGPGGFIQAFIDYIEDSRKKIKKIYAITLKSDKHYVPGWKKTASFVNKYSSILKISYGKDGSGDINKKENQDYFINEIDQKVHLFTADGGFDFSIDYTQQEKQIYNLLVSSFLIAFQILTINGLCIIKIFDTYSESTKTLISLCGSCFKEYTLYKPATSRPCNGERYFVGKQYKGINSKIVDILKNIKANIINDIYPFIILDTEELNYMNIISNRLEIKQIECIDLAKKYANNIELHKEIYEDHYNKSYEFCKVFRIPIKDLFRDKIIH